MSIEISFALAAESNIMTIIELRKEIWSTTYRGMYPDDMIDHFDYVWHKEKELQRLNNSSYREYLILKDSQAIGYLITRKTDVILLQSLYVLKEYQHQEIGTMAFEFVKQYCLQNGATSFICHCMPENWSARHFYEHMGGKIIGEDMNNDESWMNSVIYRFDFENG